MEMPKRMGVDWNEQADMYSELSFCELDDTRAYLEAVGVGAGDTLLDVCCGPGRVSVVAAGMGAAVTGIDSAAGMLAHARENAERRGVGGSCDFRLLDWNHVLAGQNLERHDVVVASRCPAMMDVARLSSLAGRTAAVQMFANAPSIPALLDVLFSGCGEGERGGARPGGGAAGGPAAASPGGAAGGPGAEPAGSGRSVVLDGRGVRTDGPDAAEALYLKVAGKAFRAGYDPNVRVFPERFRKRFDDEAAAVAWVCGLRPERAEGNEGRVASNVAPFLSAEGGGVEFCIATKAAVVWWDV